MVSPTVGFLLKTGLESLDSGFSHFDKNVNASIMGT